MPHMCPSCKQEMSDEKYAAMMRKEKQKGAGGVYRKTSDGKMRKG